MQIELILSSTEQLANNWKLASSSGCFKSCFKISVMYKFNQLDLRSILNKYEPLATRIQL